MARTTRMSKRVVASYPPQVLAPELEAALTAYTAEVAAGLPHCVFVPEFITPEGEVSLMERVDEGEWTERFNHQTQDFGWRYSQGKTEFAEQDYIGDLPDWLAEVARGLVEWGFFEETPDECLANAYKGGRGLGMHKDCCCFEDRIASVTLNSGSTFRFYPPRGHATHWRPLDLYLPRRSLFVFWGDLRQKWFHEVPTGHTDRILGVGEATRTRRVSLTFRNAKPPASRVASQTRVVGRRPPNRQTWGG